MDCNYGIISFELHTLCLMCKQDGLWDVCVGRILVLSCIGYQQPHKKVPAEEPMQKRMGITQGIAARLS